MWEIVVLDYFEVGGSTAGLFRCGRLWYWTILKWEILLLDFFAVGDSDAGQMNCTAGLVPQNDHQHLSFVKDIYAVGKTITKNSRKIAKCKGCDI
jgi:hypothetical protein